jgi:hypothetical protein
VATLWNDKCPGDPTVQRYQSSLVGLSEFNNMPVSSLLWASDPFWKMTDIVVIRNEGAPNPLGILQLKQQLARLCYRGAVLLSLAEHAHKSQLGDRTGCDFARLLPAPKSTYKAQRRLSLRIEAHLKFS